MSKGNGADLNERSNQSQFDPPNKEESPLPRPPEATKESLEADTDLSEVPMKPVERLICPKCKILYERGSSCIRCGSPLVKENPSGGKVAPEIDRSEQKEPQSPYIFESESEESLPAPEFRKEVLQAASRPEVKKDRRPIPIHAPREPSPDRLDGNWIRRGSSPGKSLRNPLRLPLEIGSILVLVVAGGYLAWSIYPNFLTKRPDPSMPLSREAAGLASVSATSGSPTVTVTEPKAAKEIDQGNESSVPEGGVGATPALSKIPFSEAQERGEINNLLEKIRQANLQKDIALFMSCYSTAFKGREGKKEGDTRNLGSL